MEIIKGNILDYINENNLVIHQVNCKGKMGAGLALQIRNKFPRVYEKYKKACEKVKPIDLLGKIQIVDGVVNMFSQYNYGTSKMQTNYKAVEDCFIKIQKIKKDRNVYIPYNLGCGLAGGNWEIVYLLINKYLPNSTIVKRGDL